MKRLRSVFSVWVILLSLVFDYEVSAQDITVFGNWSLMIDASDLTAGPGSDVNSMYMSDNDQIEINILRAKGMWAVYVRGVPMNWHPDLRFGIRRTSNGIGGGWISGGTSWLEVTSFDQQFFMGYKQRKNIDVQCGLTGVSVQIPSAMYSGTVIYTVMEL
ncbi:MAG: hypothetical protein ABIL68_10560 [bacterium]